MWEVAQELCKLLADAGQTGDVELKVDDQMITYGGLFVEKDKKSFFVWNSSGFWRRSHTAQDAAQLLFDETACWR